MIETAIIEDNWDINVRSIERIKALYSDIYIINEECVLKIADINSSKKQKIINLCMSTACEKKLPVPKIIKTKAMSGLIFSMQCFCIKDTNIRLKYRCCGTYVSR